MAQKRAGCYAVAFGGSVNCACVRVPQPFHSLLTPCFVQLFSGNSSVNLFVVYLFKYKLFIKILSLSLNTMLIVDKHCSDEFLEPQIDHKCKKVKNSDIENSICNQYGERLTILNTENIKICLHFLPYLLNI